MSPWSSSAPPVARQVGEERPDVGSAELARVAPRAVGLPAEPQEALDPPRSNNSPWDAPGAGARQRPGPVAAVAWAGSRLSERTPNLISGFCRGRGKPGILTSADGAGNNRTRAAACAGVFCDRRPSVNRCYAASHLCHHGHFHNQRSRDRIDRPARRVGCCAVDRRACRVALSRWQCVSNLGQSSRSLYDLAAAAEPAGWNNASG